MEMDEEEKVSTFTNKTGLQVLERIQKLQTSYGKNNLSTMIWNDIPGSTIQQIKDILSMLTEQEYLQEVNVGTRFAMIVLIVTEKGRTAIKNKEEIPLDYQKFYTSFKPATSIGIINKDIAEEFYETKKKILELQKREEELKTTIKKAMTEKNVGELHYDFMDLYCKRVERILYPKEKIEKFVPQSILQTIRTVQETIVLTTKLKENNQTKTDDTPKEETSQ